MRRPALVVRPDPLHDTGGGRVGETHASPGVDAVSREGDPRPRSRFINVPVLLVGLAAGAAADARAQAGGGAKRPIGDTDLHKFIWIGEHEISPDGAQI